jgi:hypothetical protein
LICAQTRELGPEAGIEVKVLLFSTEYLFNGGGKLGIQSWKVPSKHLAETSKPLEGTSVAV